MAREAKESKVEHAKRDSNYLHGTIQEVLASDADSFGHDDVQVLKFHGVYQQDDRDVRQAIKATGGDKEFIFMVRTRIPGGVVTADQYLVLDALADAYSRYGSLRITTRQGFQLHGVLKGDLKATIRAINETLLSTIAACGDVSRNVMASPVPLAGAGYDAVRGLARAIADRMAPKTRAYHEIWLNGEKAVSSEPDGAVEPIYGEAYLPRKFKVGIALPEDNSTDVHSQCVGLIAIMDGDRLKGANVLVGGGFGMTHRKAETFARLGTPLGFVDAEHIVDTVEAIATVFRDHGDRSDRKHARLKYIVEEWGIDKFRETLCERVDFEIKPWAEIPPLAYDDYLGKREQGDGKFCYGLFVENGRIVDTPLCRMKTALRTAVETLRPGIVLTPGQSIVFTDLDDDGIKKLETILTAFNVPLADKLRGVRRYSMACPAMPTCGLALADSEREMPGLMHELETELDALGLADEPITVRMTGCPNGCARPYSADLSFVGRKVGVYDINVGGRLSGDQLTDLYAENIKREALIPALRPLFSAWAGQRESGEGLGDFYRRVFTTGDAPHIFSGSKDVQARERVEAASR